MTEPAASDVSAPERSFPMSLGALLVGVALVLALALVAWLFMFHNIAALATAAGALALAGVALVAVGLYIALTDMTYDLTPAGLWKRRGQRRDFVAWADVSPFSETEPTHREGDRHCYLKDREGNTVMAVASHLLADRGSEMLAEARRRLGPPALPEDGRREVFQFRHFTGGLLFRVELTDADVSAVNQAGEVRIPFEAVERVIVRAWPEHGTGLERAKVIGDGKLIEFDSRLVGFWPLLDHVLAVAPEAEFEDQSRRGELRRTGKGKRESGIEAPSAR